jgi:hypothetical protein
MQDPEDKAQIELLISRLERISVDSYWAHRASGVRGSLIKELEKMETGGDFEESNLERLAEAGFEVLRRAAEKRIF